MPDALAGGADDTGQEGTTSLVWADRATTRIVAVAGATGATIAEAISAVPPIAYGCAVTTVIITRQIASPWGGAGPAVHSKVTAVSTEEITVAIAVTALLEA